MIFNIQSRENPKIEKIYEHSMEELSEFFNINWKKNRPRIFLVKDRKTIDELMGYKTDDYLVGWLNNLDIYILDNENFEKESSQKYSEEEYYKLIKHELVHAFTTVVADIYDKPILPDWLWEGLALYLAGQNNPKQVPEKLENFLDFYEQDMENTDVYKEAGFAVEHLVKEFGKEKLLDLIKSLKSVSSESGFSQKFENIYGLDLTYPCLSRRAEPES